MDSRSRCYSKAGGRRRDRIASETDPFGRTLRYTYDAYGNRKSRIDVAADETTIYQYDARHRNISVANPSHGTTALAWYRDDRLRTITQPGNVVSTTTWDRAARVDTITHTANGTPLVTLSYDYDPNGNRDAETLAHAGQPPVVSTYTHDEADRLASMTVDGATTTYTLDGAGNRTRERTVPAGARATLDPRPRNQDTHDSRGASRTRRSTPKAAEVTYRIPTRTHRAAKMQIG